MDVPPQAWPVEPPSFRHLSWRRRLSKRLRLIAQHRRWRREFARMRELEGRFAGQRVFLLGSGPSLRHMDLAGLQGEQVCVVNLGLRALGTLLPGATMHMVNDVACLRNFGPEIERLIIEHGIGLRFMTQRRKPHWRRTVPRGPEPYFVMSQDHAVRELGHVEDIRTGIARGATVLISASHVLDFLGFSAVYVLGCDLDYASAGAYFYPLSEQDLAHEASPDVQRRRADTVYVNQEFAAMRRHFEARGKMLVNAGLGGNLETLEREDLADVLARPRPGPALAAAGPAR